MERYHATNVLSLTARHPARAKRLDFKRFVFGRAAGRVLINGGHWPNVRSWGEPDTPERGRRD